MGRLRAHAAWLVRGGGEIRQLQAQLDELRGEVAVMRRDLEAAREESRSSVVDLTARVGAVGERLENLGR
jgi:hypothetical protein